jgi:heat shock protein HslJ
MRARLTTSAISILVAALCACGTASDAAGTSVVRSDGGPSTTTSTTVATTVAASPVPSALRGTTWRYDSNITVGGLQPVAAGTGAAITFTTDGTVEVDTGCNTGTAAARFTGEYELVLGAMALTEIACADAARSAVESSMVFVLAEPMSWSVHDGVLTLIPLHITDTGLHFSPVS